MEYVCKRLPGTGDTLRFISPFFMMPHMRKYADDAIYTPYGMYLLFTGIKEGIFRAYGVFGIENNEVSFLGFCYGRRIADWFETHAVWDRKVPAGECCKLCMDTMVEEYEREGVHIKYAAGFIPDLNKAAQRMLRRIGGKDFGLHEELRFLKNGEYHPSREFRVYVKEK